MPMQRCPFYGAFYYGAFRCLLPAALALLISAGFVVAQPSPALAADVDSLSIDSGTGLTLEDFFTAAMEYSPRLQIAGERLNIGAARVQASLGQLLPQINATTSISDNRQRTDQLITYRGERYAIQLRQVLFDWRAFSQRSQAYILENQLEAEYYGELALLLAEVSERYLNVLQAQDAFASSRTEVDAVRNQLDQIERLYGLQMVQITDLYEVQALLALVEAEQLHLFSEVTMAREALRSATGLAVGSIYILDSAAALPSVEGAVDEWVQRARQGNHVIQARERAVDLADERVSEQRAVYMPRVSLVVQQQRSNLGFDNVPINRTDSNYIGVDVTVPLFAGGSNRASVSETIALQNIARSELRQTRLEVSERTRMAYLRLQSNMLRIQASERVVESARIAATAKQRSFELGNVSSVEVLDALRNRFMAERDLQQVRYDHIRYWLYLRREAGTLTSDDLLEISTRMQPPAAQSTP